MTAVPPPENTSDIKITALDRSSHFSFKNTFRAHGLGLRGLDVPRGSEQFDGRFGRMFRTLPRAEHDEEDLEELAKAMTADPDPNREDAPDPEENRGIAAGYTYFGQFLDHDITFDPASSLQKTNDPDALVDFRTPRFDLDSVYGRGPDDQPYLYRDGGLTMLLGRTLSGDASGLTNTFDVPRNSPSGSEPARAIIGDPRNDENVIVSQLQSTFLQFHNKVFEVEKTRLGHDPTFAHVQRLVRWHYQYAILNDFLPTITGDIVFDVLPHLKSGKSIHVDKPNLRFFRWKNEPFMPVEFSVAAYRFGHSMVRPFYRLNSNVKFLIFAGDDTGNDSFRGFHAFPDTWGINWKLFFGKITEDANPNRVQPAYKIDTSLVNPLGLLPLNVAKDIRSLAARNLLRGLRMRLPSGQTVARKMGITPIPDDKLVVGKATKDDTKTPLTEISPDFANNAPLWYYVLAEAQATFFDGNDKTPIRLGPVGGRIVAEVFAGLMLGDNHSFLAQNPDWKPFSQFGGAKFGIFDLIKAALQ